MGIVRILLVDDHPLIREGLRKVLALEPNLEVVGEAGDGAEAVAKARECLPDLVLMDINMPRTDGIQAIRQLKQLMPRVKIIALTVAVDERAPEVIKAGVAGYLLKDINADNLLAAVATVAGGGTVIAPEVMEKISHMMTRLQEQQLLQQLTRRERDILGMVAQGLTNREIGERLFISEKTVKNHLTHLFKKIGVEDRTQAALFAVRMGLTEEPNS
ncbi:MAG: response regulator [Bacillota bacterium]